MPSTTPSQPSAPRPAWPLPHLTPQQRRHHTAQLHAMRAGQLARWPAGCTHLAGVA